MGDMKRSIWIGWDPREAAAFAVARHSAKRRLTQPIPIKGIVLDRLVAEGIYTGEHIYRGTQLWDAISEAPMSTEHAIARFAVKELAKTGWAMFMDGDVLIRSNLARLFDELDPSKAIYCVNHQPDVNGGEPVAKMDGKLQVP